MRRAAAVFLLAFLAVQAAADGRSPGIRIAVRAGTGETGDVAELTDDVERVLRKSKPGSVLVLASAGEEPELVLWLTRRYTMTRGVPSPTASAPALTCVVQGFVEDRQRPTNAEPIRGVTGSGVIWKQAAERLVEDAAAYAEERLQALLRGRADWPEVGFHFDDLTQERRREFGVKDGKVGVTLVQPEGAAHKAGLRFGDAVLAVDGKKVRSAADLARAIYAGAPGAGLKIDVSRRGARESVVLQLP